MIRGIHYFSTELKTKIDVIPRAALTYITADKVVFSILFKIMCTIFFKPTKSTAVGLHSHRDVPVPPLWIEPDVSSNNGIVKIISCSSVVI